MIMQLSRISFAGFKCLTMPIPLSVTPLPTEYYGGLGLQVLCLHEELGVFGSAVWLVQYDALIITQVDSIFWPKMS
jgi:hypothetical protein